jgi:hypothetical protein
MAISRRVILQAGVLTPVLFLTAEMAPWVEGDIKLIKKSVATIEMVLKKLNIQSPIMGQISNIAEQIQKDATTLIADLSAPGTSAKVAQVLCQLLNSFIWAVASIPELPLPLRVALLALNVLLPVLEEQFGLSSTAAMNYSELPQSLRVKPLAVPVGQILQVPPEQTPTSPSEARIDLKNFVLSSGAKI